ncbi:hypothetical protein, partial [Clostridioides sp. ZZV14-6048]|uniref:hypothetical protein n=1 Tax=Clostridioides sp. ZZV14-6048 TaxID=2811490 RepID=UPI001D1289C9|nr:hypothetical protein [Clostridioides sp. ZZV14-6048]
MEDVADMAVFSYFNFAKWSTADTFNLAIGAVSYNHFRAPETRRKIGCRLPLEKKKKHTNIISPRKITIQILHQ